MRQARGSLQQAYVDDGRLIASDDFNDMSSARARNAIAERHDGDGLRARQRQLSLARLVDFATTLLGHADSIVYCAKCGEVPVPDDQLPVLLPPNARFAAKVRRWRRCRSLSKRTVPNATARRGARATRWTRFSSRRGTYLRYLDPHDDALPWERERADRWMNVDQYVGGSEHAVLHLLYSRFFYKFFHDRGWVGGCGRAVPASLPSGHGAP